MLVANGVAQTARMLPACTVCCPPQPHAWINNVQGQGKTGVLFVCLGNICRSPTAEAMFRAVVEREGVADKFDIDSCGTGGGNPGW